MKVVTRKRLQTWSINECILYYSALFRSLISPCSGSFLWLIFRERFMDLSYSQMTHFFTCFPGFNTWDYFFFTIYGFKSRLYGLIFYFWLAKAHRKYFITKKRQVWDFTRLQADQINHWWTLLGIFVVVMSLSVQHPFPWNPTKSLTLWTVSSLARLQTAELQPGIRNSYPVMMTQDTP